jgi:myo-inositol 2-dehydrogenase / D-chiro-inositol 1-dehydrogenase
MIDFCLVGAGFIGPVHAANLAANPGARLKWVIDLDLHAAEVLAAKRDARAGRDLGEALPIGP